LAAFGSVHGTIKTPGRPPVDTAAVTGRTCAGKPISAASLPKGPVPAVVWIQDIRSGKPFPVEKRTELSSDDCVLDPPIQAAVVGTTFNVFNDDKEVHRLVFTRSGTHDTLTVMPFFNSGQMVASERLAKGPGIVDVQCARHPWMHGYIAVFSQPYFAVTDENGGFAIDSVPPGSYTVLAWHEGMASPSSQSVQIAANGRATVDLTLP
jgi:Carboxypeptidase regulatory-like domain